MPETDSTQLERWQRERREAWDRYAAACMQVTKESYQGMADEAAAAAERADALLKERDARFAPSFS